MVNTNIGLLTPVNGDSTYRAVWAGQIINPNMGVLDNYTAQQLTKDVSGNFPVALTYAVATTSEAIHSHFNFTGVLTGNISIYFPQNIQLNFSAQNNTTGAFTVTMAANNGSVAPAGRTVFLSPGGAINMYRSDGVNIDLRSGGGVVLPVSISNGGTGQSTAALARAALDSPGLAEANTFTGVSLFDGSQRLQVNAGDADAHPVAFMNMTGATQYSGRITWGSGSPGTLAVGEVYLQIP